ncbi:YGR277C-like protein [Saccharomyces cerevisiae x Saccharomyces kudriavzevii VIN7]|uniref:YGR277C-like protein n=1 Tax=Saccharomyces cerevisiae x Saccharomyces kudriavzevii (strain VIN7) TaxID=1095631 RepID=H0GVG5_SACCK|nr:YGR277C-like protein [Saccharomyces cerevisiae x Saccharomyces kudriavzevii VIN7]
MVEESSRVLVVLPYILPGATLQTIIRRTIPFLREWQSQLDVVVVPEFKTSFQLDSALGKMYSIIRDVLLGYEMINTGINIIFNTKHFLKSNLQWKMGLLPQRSTFETWQLELDVKQCRTIEHYAVHGDSAEEIVGPKDADKFPVTALGGTFDHIHDGHKILLSVSTFITSQRLICGITCDELLQNKKYKELIEPYETRCSHVSQFIELLKPNLLVELVPLKDVCGPTGKVPEIECLVVSRETIGGAETVNKTRIGKGMNPLAVHVVNVLGGREEDGWSEKLSSTEIRRLYQASHSSNKPMGAL